VFDNNCQTSHLNVQNVLTKPILTTSKMCKLMMITDCHVELGVESGLILREVVKINNNIEVYIAELNTANAVNNATKD
jgi:hypothetical protein